MNYNKFLCKEKDFQFRRPYLSELQYVEKVYTPISLQKMLPLYIVSIIMCIVAFVSTKDMQPYLLSEGVIRAIRFILLILPVVFIISIADDYLHPRRAEDAMVTEVEITKIYNYRARVVAVPVSVDVSECVDIWSEEQKKFAVCVNSGDLHFHAGDKGLLIKHPKRNGFQRFLVWEKDKYSVIKVY